MSLYLVDGPARLFRPLAWTRPLCELLFGAETFRERIDRLSRGSVAGAFSHGRFEALPYSRLGASPLRVNPRLPDGEPFTLLDSVYVPRDAADPVFADRRGSTRFWLRGAIVGARFDVREARDAVAALTARADWRRAARTGADVELPGELPPGLYRLVHDNAEQIVRDLADSEAPAEVADRAGVTVEGPRERLRIAPGAELVPPVHVDVREGPVRIDPGVRVEPFTILHGPLVARAGTQLLGGEVGPGCTLGPGCKIRGEMQGTIVLGLSNKAHEGFVGDSYIGEWVNLGAGTTTSNLKNNYGHVRLRLPDEAVETGMLKLGSLIGDHVKTGIGTLLPTGAIVGPGTNLYGTCGPAPPFLPAFSWGAGTHRETHRLDAFVESARRVMERRGMALEREEAGMLGAVFRASEPERIPA